MGFIKKDWIGLLSATCTLLIGLSAAYAEEATHPPGPQAIIGLYDGAGEAEPVSVLIDAAFAALADRPDVKIMAAPETVRRLGGGEPERDDPAELDRLNGVFQQGYLQSYSFEYDKAEASLQEVLTGLARLVPTPARWDLFIRANIFLGVARFGAKDEAGAIRAFLEVMRTRPDFKLERAQYSPKIVSLWAKAQTQLADLPRGRLVVESDPAGANVLLDGAEVGKTPYIGDPPLGRYHLEVRHPEAGLSTRWVEVGEGPARVRVQLEYEGSLNLGRGRPLVREGSQNRDLPAAWCAWLRLRLGTSNLIIIGRVRQAGRVLLGAALVDLERSHKVREGWIEQRGDRPDDQGQDVRTLLDFLLTGRATERVIRKDDDGGIKPPIPPPPEPQAPPAARPWYRRWWPYAATGGAFLALGIGSHLTSLDYGRQARDALTIDEKNTKEGRRDAWLGVAVAGYVLAAGAVTTGIVLDLTFRSEPAKVSPTTGSKIALIPVVGTGYLGIGWMGLF